jgi:rhamnogalacturonan acetylesterase
MRFDALGMIGPAAPGSKKPMRDAFGGRLSQMNMNNKHNERRLAGLKRAALPLVLATLAPCGFAETQAKPPAPPDSHYLAGPANPALPTLFIIGDSTVRNGNGTGHGGQWGWGDFLAPYFDTNRINVVNDALGGTSSRTFYRDRWPGVKAMMKPGDFLILQFGHNDSSPVNEAEAGPKARARGTIRGVGTEIELVTNVLTKRFEVVHSFGWYEKQFINEARACGAAPMVCSLIPHNNWKGGKAVRDQQSYAGWAGETARAEHAPFLDINEIIARQYDQMGEEKVKPLFIVGAGPHTSRAGAETNAACVVAALKGLQKNPLANYFSDQAQPIMAADLSRPESGNPKHD